MNAALRKTLAATTLTAALAGFIAGPLAGVAAAMKAQDERRGAETDSRADKPAAAELARDEVALAPAVVSDHDVARTSGYESAAVQVSGDPVTRAPAIQRARGPPQA